MVFLAASGLSFFLFSMVVVSSLVVTFKPNNVKTMLRSSGVYDNIVEDVLRQSKTLNKDTSGSGDNKNAFDDPGVQAVAKKTFTPEFIRTSVEEIIDGISPWLESKTPKPVFAVDLGQVKNSFADNIGEYARTRYAGLPVCQAGQMPDTTDILTVSCKPSGYNPEPEIQKAVTELKSDPKFLDKTVITPDDLVDSSGSDKRPLFDRLSEVPKAYHWATVAPYIFGGLALLSAMIIIIASEQRRHGFRRVATNLFLTGGLLLAEVLLVGKLMIRAEDHVSKSAADNAGLNKTVISVLKLVENSLNSVVLIFAISFLVIAIVITVYLIMTRPSEPKADKIPKEASEHESPDKPEEDVKEAAAEPEDKPKQDSKNGSSKS